MSAPKKMAPADFEEVCAAHALGQSVTQIASETGFSRQQIYRYAGKTPDNEAAWQASQRQYAARIMEETIEIADSDPDPQRARNRINARHHYASKLNPAVWGDKLQVEVEHKMDLSIALDEARKRRELRAMCAPGDTNVIETHVNTPLIDVSPTDKQSVDAPPARPAEVVDVAVDWMD